MLRGSVSVAASSPPLPPNISHLDFLTASPTKTSFIPFNLLTLQDEREGEGEREKEKREREREREWQESQSNFVSVFCLLGSRTGIGVGEGGSVADSCLVSISSSGSLG